MENLMKNIVVKVLIFLALQIALVNMVVSGAIVAFNVGYELYSADNKKISETILQEIGLRFEHVVFDAMHFSAESGQEKIYWADYLYEDTELPRGIGYEIRFKDIDHKQLEDISLKKNVEELQELDGTYKTSMETEWYELTVYVADPKEIQADVSEIYPQRLAVMYELYKNMYDHKWHAVLAGGASFVVTVLMFTYMAASVGKSKKGTGYVDKMPLDLFVCIAVMLGVCDAVLIGDLLTTYNYDAMILGLIALIFTMSVIVTGTLLFIVMKVKRGHWWKGTLIYLLLKLFIKIMVWCLEKMKACAAVLKKVPLVWKTVVVTAIIMTSNFIIAINLYWSGVAVVCWFVGTVVISAGVIYVALCMKRLKIAAEKLASGDMDYKIDKKGLVLDFADHADNLNSIGNGMAVAVQEKTKSERFKAELITNVSHDIKTPLTSIINYVDLLKKENIEDNRIEEYIDVLDRQSMRLKKLTEDIIDASKAATGNVRMEFMPCKVGLLVSQTVAEYKEKAEKEELEIIMKLLDDEVEILADGRRMWRVFDNLFNNICKYAHPGTRVYINLEIVDNKAVIIYRNVSKYALDITEDELMERFVRGDKSRNTEGSGLGLSIARNLVELQGGNFDIQIDGDLFKVIIKFNLLNL